MRIMDIEFIRLGFEFDWLDIVVDIVGHDHLLLFFLDLDKELLVLSN